VSLLQPGFTRHAWVGFAIALAGMMTPSSADAFRRTAKQARQEDRARRSMRKRARRWQREARSAAHIALRHVTPEAIAHAIELARLTDAGRRALSGGEALGVRWTTGAVTPPEARAPTEVSVYMSGLPDGATASMRFTASDRQHLGSRLTVAAPHATTVRLDTAGRALITLDDGGIPNTDQRPVRHFYEVKREGKGERSGKRKPRLHWLGSQRPGAAPVARDDHAAATLRQIDGLLPEQ